MELWIRSQDREFIMQINNINLGISNRLFTFVNDATKLTSFTLGEYKTKERTLEILDEIQKLMIRIEENKNMGYINNNYNTAIYNMPKE